MTKLYKWIMVGIGVVVFLFVMAAVVLPMVVDPNDYKQEIRDAVRAKTGRELTIGGEIQWTVFPWIGLNLSDLAFGNRAGFGDQPMCSVGEVEVLVKLMPLFSQKVEIGNVRLIDVSIYLRQNSDGRNNWEDLGDAQAATPSKTPSDSSDPGAFRVSGVEISNANLRWDDAGQITELTGLDLVASNIELGRPFDLQGGFSVNLAQPQLAGEASFSGVIQSADDGSSYGIKDFQFSFNEIVVDGEFNVTSLSTNPRLDFDVHVNALNIDELVPETGDESEETDLTVDVFRGLNAGGEIRIGELIVAGMTATDVKVTVKGDANGVHLFPITAQFYGGQYEGDVKIDANGQRPILVTSQQLTAVRAEGLLEDLTGSARLEGAGDFKLQVRTDLSNSRSIREALSGDMGLSFMDGAIVGINVAETIRAAKSQLGRDKDGAAESGQDLKTDFSELSMTGVFEQGILKSDDLKMQSPLLRVTGKGSVNLVEETIDYRLKPILVGSLEGQGGQGLDELSGVPIPVNLRGNLYDPDISVDVVAVVSGTQKAKISEKKDKLIGRLLGGKDESASGSEEDVEDKGDSAKTLLKGIFGSKKDKDETKDDG